LAQAYWRGTGRRDWVWHAAGRATALGKLLIVQQTGAV
jgi:hypothetical protein